MLNESTPVTVVPNFYSSMQNMTPVPWLQTVNTWLQVAKTASDAFAAFEHYEMETYYMQENLRSMPDHYSNQHQHTLGERQKWLAQNQTRPVEQANIIWDQSNEILKRFGQLIEQISNGSLKQWKMAQKKHQAGFPLSTEHLDDATKGFQSLTKILLELRDMVSGLEISRRSNQFQFLSKLRDEIRAQFATLLQKSMVFCDQSPMFLRNEAALDKFSMKIRLLAATPGFNCDSQTSGPVTCCYISEDTAVKLRNRLIGRDKIETAALLSHMNGCRGQKKNARAEFMTTNSYSNNDGTMEAKFENVVLHLNNRKITVEREKLPCGKRPALCQFYFVIFWNIYFDGFTFPCCALSLPSLVAVGKTQYCNIGEIMWDTFFSNVDTIPYVGRENVSWQELQPVLKHFFQFMTGTMKELTQTELKHLGRRLVGPSDRLRPETIISRDQFFNARLKKNAKNPPQDLKFSFYEWFYESAELLVDRDRQIARYSAPPNRKRKSSSDDKRDMRGLYDMGVIQGFLSKKRAETYLRKGGQVALLIRFSDNHCGYLTICCYRDNQVNSIAPIRRDFVRSLSLPSIVGHCSTLREVNRIFAGDGKFHEKKILTEFELNKPASLYEDYCPIELEFGPPGRDKIMANTVMPLTPEMSPSLNDVCLTPPAEDGQQGSDNTHQVVQLQQALQQRTSTSEISPGCNMDMDALVKALNDPEFQRIINSYSSATGGSVVKHNQCKQLSPACQVQQNNQVSTKTGTGTVGSGYFVESFVESSPKPNHLLYYPSRSPSEQNLMYPPNATQVADAVPPYFHTPTATPCMQQISPSNTQSQVSWTSESSGSSPIGCMPNDPFMVYPVQNEFFRRDQMKNCEMLDQAGLTIKAARLEDSFEDSSEDGSGSDTQQEWEEATEC